MRNVLFPADPMGALTGFRRGIKVDEHFQDEMLAARAAGASVGYYDHDALVAGDVGSALSHLPESVSGATILRGYMLSVDVYTQLYTHLADRYVQLQTTPQQYQAAHCLPGWHALVDSDLTAAAVWTDQPEAQLTQDMLAALPAGAGMLKDYVKSLKHDVSASKIKDVHDPSSVTNTVNRFRQLRGDALQGGLVVRAWQTLHQVEWRTWWVDGVCVLVDAHPDTDGQTPDTQPPIERVAKTVAALGSAFLTVDFAQTETGAWQVVEIGDGQVSDRPRCVEAAALITAVVGD